MFQHASTVKSTGSLLVTPPFKGQRLLSLGTEDFAKATNSQRLEELVVILGDEARSM